MSGVWGTITDSDWTDDDAIKLSVEPWVISDQVYHYYDEL
jgi:hypothetical protein